MERDMKEDINEKKSESGREDERRGSEREST